MRLLCASDLHLGRQSLWLNGSDEVDRSTTGAWRRIVELAIRERVDGVLLGGDIFDGAGSYYAARTAFSQGLRDLTAMRIPVAAVAGNHDWDALPRFCAAASESGMLLLGAGGRWQTGLLETGSGPLHLCGWSFERMTQSESALPHMPSRLDDGYRVALVHGDVGVAGSAYHPLSAAELDGRADAWVLGHIHLGRRITPTALYPGSPQALDFGPGERVVHGVRILTLDDGGARFSEIHPISTVRFEECVLTLEEGVRSEGEDLDRRVDGLFQEFSRLDGVPIEHLESVQLRVRLEGYDVEPRQEVVGVTDLTGRHAWTRLSYRRLLQDEPWTDVNGSDVAAESAQLLVALNNLNSDPPDDRLLPEWCSRVMQLVDDGVREMERTWDRSLGRVPPTGESAPRKPSPEQLREMVIEAARTELTSLRRQVLEARRSA